MTSLFTKRKMFIIATGLFMVTMSTVLFMVGEGNIDIELDHDDLHTFVMNEGKLYDEPYYRNFLNLPDEEFAIVDSDRKFIFITDELQNRHGYKLEESKEMNVLSLIHPKDLTEFANFLMEYNKEPKETEGIGPIRIKTQTGQYISYLLNLIPIFDEKGQKTASAVVLKDISIPVGDLSE